MFLISNLTLYDGTRHDGYPADILVDGGRMRV